MSEVLNEVSEGKHDRVMFHLPPRTSKSEMMSVRFPPWHIGHNPHDHILHTTHTADLTLGFSRSIRNLIASEEYQKVFPTIKLKSDENAAKHWAIYQQGQKGLVHPGQYHAAGAGSSIAGRGFHLGIIDDALSEQDAFSDTRVKRINDWYGPGFYTRMNPERNIILLAATRWRLDDLPNHIIKLAKEAPEFADTWKVVNFAAIIGPKMAAKLNTKRDKLARIVKTVDPDDAVRPIEYKKGSSFAPRRHALTHLKKVKATMPDHYWGALYQQRPVKARGVIILREYWRQWPYDNLPDITFLISCYDTAFEEDEQADDDESACTTWGVFELPEGGPALILLDTWHDQLAFPKLKIAVKMHHQHWKEDLILIEKRASGASLIQELQQTRLPIRPWLPPGNLTGTTKKARVRGKMPRTHASTEMFAQGRVWYIKNEQNEDAITQSAAFPFGDKDDVHDTVTMAVLFLRKRVRLDESLAQNQEEAEEDDRYEPPRTKREARLQQARRQQLSR